MFKLVIETNTPAFTTQPPMTEILAILSQTKGQLRNNAGTQGVLTDSDGTEVGRWEYFPEPDQWHKFLADARALSEVDLHRHASVSLGNGHRCTQCYCCAALTVLEELEAGCSPVD